MISENTLQFSKHHHEVLIRETHIDTLGHVNNATYLQLFEEARWEFLTQRHFGIGEIQRKKLGPVILEIHLKFHKEIKLREKVIIETETLDYEGKIGTLSQLMLKQDHQVACEAKMVFGLFDIEARKLILPTKEWLYAIGGPSIEL